MTESCKPKNCHKKVILIDDELDILELYPIVFRSFLPKFTLDIHTFTNGDQAFQYIKRNHDSIDLVFTDNNHPGMSGISIAQVIKMSYPNIKIMISTAALNKKIVRLSQQNSDYYTPKPVNLRDFCKQLEFLLNDD